MKKTAKIKKAFGNAREKFEEYEWWELAVFFIGLASFVSMLVVIFLPVGKGPAEFIVAGSVPPASSPEFLSTVSHSLTLPVLPGGAVKILNNGDEFMESFLADIDAAERSINITTFIWDKGAMSDQVFAHLLPKLKEGVEVRILLDAFGGFGSSTEKDFKEFKELGGKVEVFHSLTAVPWNISSNNKRNHRRAIIFDGKAGYTGGMAIGDEWLGDARNEKEYRDMMFRVEGEMARSIQGAFAELWTSETGEFLAGDAFFPAVVPEDGRAGALRYVPMGSTANSDSLLLQKFVLLSVMAAENKIYISTPYLLPDPTLRDTLIEKAGAGIDVRILLPNDNNDSKGVRYASQSYYEDLLRGGVKIYEYQPTLIHTKTMVIDGVWSVVGSPNMDPRSRQLNAENALGIWNREFAATMEDVFFEDLKESKQIILSEWEERSIWQRAREIFALKFVEQY